MRKQTLHYAVLIAIILVLTLFVSCKSKNAAHLSTKPEITETDKQNIQPDIAKTEQQNTETELVGVDSKEGDKTFKISTYKVQETHCGDNASLIDTDIDASPWFITIDLDLPAIEGDYAGIPRINAFFAGRKKFHYEENPYGFVISDAPCIEHSNMPDDPEDLLYFFERTATYGLSAKFGSIISISASLGGSAGGVGWTAVRGFTFDLNDGKRLALSDIFIESSDYLNVIHRHLAQGIADEIADENEDTDGFDISDPLSEEGLEMVAKAYEVEDFILSNDSLVLFFQKYAIADGASGVRIYSIPYSNIKDILAIDVNLPK